MTRLPEAAWERVIRHRDDARFDVFDLIPPDA